MTVPAVDSIARAQLFEQTDRALTSRDAVMRWFVPGRIEVLGKHTDYAGGRSLLCAVERGFCVSAIARDDDVLRVSDVISGFDATFRVSAALPDESRWRNYPGTVARRLARNFPPGRDNIGDSGGDTGGGAANGGALRGAEIAFASDLPRSSGLSSSSALIIAIFSVLAEVNALDQRAEYRANIPTDDALASYLGCIENGRTFGTLAGDRGVGTHGGSQDHLAIVGSRPRHLVSCRFSPVGREQFLPLPSDHVFVVAASGVTATKTGRALERYNRAAAAVGAILDLWRRDTGRADATLFDAIASDTGAAERLRGVITRQRGPFQGFPAGALAGRLEQFQRETFSYIPAAVAALAADDLPAFGDAVDRSQEAATRHLGNQIPETIALAAFAREAGAAAASAFGAGFGGSVWALVRESGAEAFLADWRGRYLARFPFHAGRAVFFTSGAGPGRLRL